MSETITPQEYFENEERQLAAWGGRGLLKLELLLDYSEPFRRPASAPSVHGVAALRWSPVADGYFINADSVREHQAILAVCLYAKALTIDPVNRADLFLRVENAAMACRRSGDWSSFSVEPWLDIQHPRMPTPLRQVVWPWRIAPWAEVEANRFNTAPPPWETGLSGLMKSYTATLLSGPETPTAPAGVWLKLQRQDYELGLVLVPSVALIAISDVMRTVPKARGMMISLLQFVNRYFGSPDEVPPWGEATAVRAALHLVVNAGKGDIGRFRREDDAMMARMEARASLVRQQLRAQNQPRNLEEWAADGLSLVASRVRDALRK